MPLGTTWKLSFFISILFIFISSSLFASENPSLETVVHAEPSIEIDQHGKSVVFVTEGTVIFGMENMSQNAEFKPVAEKKSKKKNLVKSSKNLAVSKKIIEKVKTEQKIQKPEGTTHISSHQSEHSFETSRQRSGVGTLTFNNYLKSAIIKDFAAVVNLFTGNTNLLYEYYNSSKGAESEFFSFTRPPPFS